MQTRLTPKKIINWSEYPEFTIMYNPLEILSLGVYHSVELTTIYQMPKSVKVPYFDINPFKLFDVKYKVDFFTWYHHFYTNPGYRIPSKHNTRMVNNWKLAVIEQYDRDHESNDGKGNLLALGWSFEDNPHELIKI